MSESVRRLSGISVTLGVSGGIAAYKAIEVLRSLVELGADVTPVLTRDAHHFVGPVTFEALAGRRIPDSLWEGDDPIPHTTLGQSSDAILVVPATAHLLARYAGGFADELLTATLIATRAPVMVAPAMHTEMWEHPAVISNIKTLKERGVSIVEPETGRLAGGDVGIGRLAEPSTIVAGFLEMIDARGIDSESGPERTKPATSLEGLHVLVTAGGTREPIDPVRFIGNRSSGKMGNAIAAAAAEAGASVSLVTAGAPPLHLAPVIEIVEVETASEMEKETMSRFGAADVVLMAAAVADFKPAAQMPSKIKKAGGVPTIQLEPTPDILAGLSGQKAGQFIVGFAAETDDLMQNAGEKLRAKQVDLIVANDVSSPDSGFEVDTNRVTLLWKSGSSEELPLLSKADVARLVVDRVGEALKG